MIKPVFAFILSKFLLIKIDTAKMQSIVKIENGQKRKEMVNLGNVVDYSSMEECPSTCRSSTQKKITFLLRNLFWKG